MRGHVGAAGRPERKIVSGQFLLTYWMMLWWWGRELRALTAEVGTPPVLGLSSSMGTLPGVLSQGMADTAGLVRALTETEVLPASLQVAAGVHQGRAVREQMTFQDLLTDALDKGKTHAEFRPLASQKHLGHPRAQSPPPHPARPFLSRLTNLVEQFFWGTGRGSWHCSVGPSIFWRFPNSRGVNLTSAGSPEQLCLWVPGPQSIIPTAKSKGLPTEKVHVVL